MATQFRSAVSRGFWLGAGLSTAVDFAIVFLLSLFFDLTMGQRLLFSAVIIAAFGLFSFLYGLLGVAKGFVFFALHERKSRVAGLMDEFTRLRMPKPGLLYVDASEYLTEVAKSPNANTDSRFFAATALGYLEALRTTNQMYLSMTSAIALEDAIKEYGRRVGFVRPDGSAADADEEA
ncbi:hypothetical protein GOB10_22495 [Sinorhizobium meliloti]|uniref:hypothetical protein n=1 Tax=Rhizobium meliloti TaxID=382 RepID=UPI001298044B|nr:hypothetical protein [Sinorhizobium meliloti]MDX0657911.1 hypothetical protein [Sinorhizobium medicae]MDW9898500.1 hypothetical protein [Sinorhizobium meliloti]MDX0183242.1 hypothetical protein [Sinorhizobium meliloti]MDX0911073.1 hypothetical protein [Sinorhizobium medicae]MDX1083224.1 hypothetical protein [Sinorhizobium medicae]